MKPTPEQCQLAIEIGAALIHQAGRSATDLIRAGQVGSPVLDSRLAHTLDAASGNIPANVADLVREFYAQDGGTRSEVVRMRLSPAEKAALQQKADAAGMSISAFVRQTCDL